MDRKEFGKLLSMLRQDMDWTQFQLAEYAQLDEAVISQMERGVKKYFEPELLIKLANSFHLTTIERKEFFLAASGITNGQIVRQPSAALKTDTINSEKVLAKMIKIIEKLTIPAFIMDVYADVLAANNAAFTFFNTPVELLASASSVAGGYNTVRLMFGKDLSMRSHITESWDNYAVGSMRFVRENSLRYRATPYFQYLMKSFQNPVEYPLFNRYWKMVSSYEQDRESNVDVFSYTHDEYGPLQYATATTISITPHGELFLNQYLPLDAHTQNLFTEILKKSGTGVLAPLAPWPEKKMIE
jgi:transcriptional regulator with XRE-family HTH domain